MSDKIEQAELFGSTSKALIQALVQFCTGLQPHFTPLEAAKMVVGAAAWLLAAAVGREAMVAMMRSLADSLEKGETPTTMN
jgi:hypothetical protein